MDKNEKIKPNIEWMHKWFKIMNQELFNNYLDSNIELGIFTSGLGSNGNTLGWFKLSNNNLLLNRNTRQIFINGINGIININYNNFAKICKPTILLNGNYKGTEDAWLNTLIHEMCHYYTYIDGFAPKQAHGKEFREISSIISNRSNGRFTIQRLANAEQMLNYELDSSIEKKNINRRNRQISKLIVLLIIMKDKSIRLTTTTSESLIKNIIEYHDKMKDSIFKGFSVDTELINYLIKKGYESNSRKYTYWNISNDKDLINKCLTVDWDDSYSPNKYELSDIIGNNIKSQFNLYDKDSLLNQYKIIKDDIGYNILDKYTNKKCFGHSLNKIEYLPYENKFLIKMKNITLKGDPKNRWEKINENCQDSFINIIINEVVNDFINNEKNIIRIDPEMNLGIENL